MQELVYRHLRGFKLWGLVLNDPSTFVGQRTAAVILDGSVTQQARCLLASGMHQAMLLSTVFGTSQERGVASWREQYRP